MTELRGRERRHRRVAPGAPVRLSLELGPGGGISLPVRNLSMRGLSFDGPRVPFRAGESLSAYVQDAAERHPIRLSVRWRREHEGQVLVGAEVSGSTFRRLSLRHVYWGTDEGSAFHDQVWNLYRSSGYFSLSGKESADFVEMERSVMDAHLKLDPFSDLGYRIVHAPAGRVVASMSIFRPYEGTWFGHQMAKAVVPGMSRKDSREALRSLYERAFEPLIPEGDCRWVVGACEEQVPWMRKAHFNFALQYVDQGLACLTPFRLLEVPCDEGESVIGPEFSVERAGPREQAAVLAWLARIRPAAYLDALDLVPERSGLESIGYRWNAAGLERSRVFYVARRGKEVMAAAVVETGHPGLNVFRLLDAVRIFPMAPHFPGGESACLELLVRACKEHFRALGRDRFLYYCEGACGPHTEGMKDLGGGYLWVVHAGLIGTFLDHVRALTA